MTAGSAQEAIRRRGVSLGKPQHGRGIAAAFLILGFVALALDVVLASDASRAHLVVGTAAALTCAGVGAALVLTGGRPLRDSLALLRLGPWFGVVFALVFGVATLVWVPGDLRYGRGVDPSAFPGALVVSAVGLFAVCVGYLLTPRSWRRLAHLFDAWLRGPQRASASDAQAWRLWSVAIAFAGIQAVTGRLGYLADPTKSLAATSSVGVFLSALSQVGELGTLVMAYRTAVRPSGRRWLSLAVILASQVAVGILSASKEGVTLQVLAAAIGLSQGRRLRLRWFVAAAAIIALASPVVTAYRQLINTGSGRLTLGQVVDQVDFGGLLASSLTGSALGGTGVPDTLGRWSRIGDVAIIERQTPSPIPYAPPTELLAAPLVSVIPRSVWPGKPVFATGYELAVRYYGQGTTTYSSAAATPYGDLYRHGGLWTVLAGGAVLGGLLRLVDSRGTGDIRQMYLPLLMFPVLIKQEAGFSDILASGPILLFTLFVAYRLSDRWTADVPAPRALPEGHPAR